MAVEIGSVLSSLPCLPQISAVVLRLEEYGDPMQLKKQETLDLIAALLLLLMSMGDYHLPPSGSSARLAPTLHKKASSKS